MSDCVLSHKIKDLRFLTPPLWVLVSIMTTKISRWWGEEIKTCIHIKTWLIQRASAYRGRNYKSSDCASDCAIHQCSKKPYTLTSVVLAGQSWGIKIFWRSPQCPRSVPYSQSHAVVPLVLLDWARLVPQHVNQGSNDIMKEKIPNKL